MPATGILDRSHDFAGLGADQVVLTGNPLADGTVNGSDVMKVTAVMPLVSGRPGRMAAGEKGCASVRKNEFGVSGCASVQPAAALVPACRNTPVHTIQPLPEKSTEPVALALV